MPPISVLCHDDESGMFWALDWSLTNRGIATCPLEVFYCAPPCLAVLLLLYDIRFLHKMPCHWLFICVQQQDDLLHQIHSVVFGDLHWEFSVLGSIFPLGHRGVLCFPGSFQELGMQQQQPKEQHRNEFRKVQEKNDQLKQFSFDAKHYIGFSDRLAATWQFWAGEKEPYVYWHAISYFKHKW